MARVKSEWGIEKMDQKRWAAEASDRPTLHSCPLHSLDATTRRVGTTHRLPKLKNFETLGRLLHLPFGRGKRQTIVQPIEKGAGTIQTAHNGLHC